MQIKLKGLKALAALLVIGAVAAGKLAMERQTLETEAAEELKFWLSSEYLGEGLAEFDSVAAMGEEEARAMTDELLRRAEVEFTDISARGRGDDVVVRVEVRVSGGDPPDGQRVRYFRMSHSALTGWRVLRETWALSYYLRFW